MTEKQTTQQTQSGEKIIQNVRTLDLTGMTEADLAKIAKIRNVALLIVPEAIVGTLAMVELENVQQTFPVPAGKRVDVRTVNGPAQMGGDGLINEDDELIIILITSATHKFRSFRSNTIGPTTD